MKENALEKATFAAGCFWGVEAAFRQIPGVVATRVGYTGGHTTDPTYERVCSHTTGHAEAVEVTYDPERVSYEQLLDVFWTKHNPTTKNRQGLDIGDQYRSAIFFHSPEQQEIAERTKEAVQAKLHWPRKVVTEIVPAPEFYEAEDYHQQYHEKLGRSSCTVELAEARAAS
jgi:peptide-methionine (S)-S-oxide reductase